MTEQTTQSSIGELMQRDPLNLTNQDLDVIIAGLRKQRHLFVAENNKTVGKPEVRKSAAQKGKEEAAAKIAAAGIDLDDLFKDL